MPKIIDNLVEFPSHADFSARYQQILAEIMAIKRTIKDTENNIQDITRWREDMNFMFEWQEQYLTNERGPDERSRTFSENFRKYSKMSDDCQRLGRPEDDWMMHQRI